MAGDAGKVDENAFPTRRRRLTLVTPEADLDDDDSVSNSEDVEFDTNSDSMSPDERDSYVMFLNLYDAYVDENKQNKVYDAVPDASASLGAHPTPQGRPGPPRE
eukprot:8559470-Heterocapsa_arctica.AAC.1